MVTSNPPLMIVDDTSSTRTMLAHTPIPSAVTLQHQLPDGPIYTSIHRGILLVEPDITLLTAEALLLTRSNYCVTPAFTQGEIFALRETKAIALAILSDGLGPRLLSAVARAVRKQWPLARILLLGGLSSGLEDHLYDEQIDHSSEPKQLLKDVERLYNDSWNSRSNTLDWNAQRSWTRAIRSQRLESDPTKAPHRDVTDDKSLRGTPSGIRYRPR